MMLTFCIANVGGDVLMKDRYDKNGIPLELKGIKYCGNRISNWKRVRDQKRIDEKYPKIDDWIK